MAIVKGVPDIVIYAGGAFAVYYFFIREDQTLAPIQPQLRARTQREKYLAATEGQRISGRAGGEIKSRYKGKW